MPETIHITLSKADIRLINWALTAKINQLHRDVTDHESAGRNKIADDTDKLALNYFDTRMRIVDALEAAE